jgi:hypothetical protein
MLNHIITETIVPEWVETIVGKYLWNYSIKFVSLNYSIFQ